MGVVNTLQANVESEIARLAADAESYESAGEYARAEELLSKILRMKESMVGGEDPQVIDDLYNLALLCYAQDKFYDADACLLRVLAMESKIGADHRQLAETLNMLAQVHYEHGNYQQAEVYCTHALNAQQRPSSPRDVKRALSRLEFTECFAPD